MSRRPAPALTTGLSSYDPGSKLYEATGPFDVAVAAETRAEQEAQLDAELAMLWQEYALAEPATLISAAQQLRQKFLAMFGDIFEKRKRKWNRR